ncbi:MULTISPECIES: hypothetical protein [unclassified Nocardiopsis]|uniref:hypothetical protein n=1 Tax=unclassified Nocardiopsis TaxID=2649073 RepID=UPI00135C4C9D|nr:MULTISPECIES: hypothetical protein [unclassified Nocardiopsis]
MLRKLGVAGLVAGAAFSVVLSASPASASDGQQFNQNLQLVPIQLCNVQAAAGLVAINLPILSPQTTGACINGPVGTNID